jgi:hypothetical protein
MKEIKLRNDILTPKVLEAYRAGNLDFSTISGTDGPLKEIYKNTYQYLEYPDKPPIKEGFNSIKETFTFPNMSGSSKIFIPGHKSS